MTSQTTAPAATVTSVTARDVYVEGATWKAHLILKRYSNSTRNEMEAKTRAYGAVESFAADTDAQYEDIQRMEHRLASKNQEGTEAWNRMNTAGRVLRAKVHRQAKPAIDAAMQEINAALNAAGISVFIPSTTAPRFSAHAGCSCFCSPGYILSHRMTVDSAPVDVFFSPR
jgi:hypothetical protein